MALYVKGLPSESFLPRIELFTNRFIRVIRFRRRRLIGAHLRTAITDRVPFSRSDR